MKDLMSLLLALLMGTAAPAADQSTRTAELGGRILGPWNGWSDRTATVLAYSDGRCVGAAKVRPDGSYELSLPPGKYWMQVKLGDMEVAAEPVEVTTGSMQHDIGFPVSEFSLTGEGLAAQARQPQPPPHRG